jgi:hypothetical protein
MDTAKTPGDSTTLKYREEANTFNLEITYTPEKVVVSLQDYVEWAIYEKSFTEKDIGK